MGKAATSAAADTAISSTGGQLTVNEKNTLGWIIAALVLLVLGFVWLKGKR